MVAKTLKFNVPSFALKANAPDSITLDNQDNGIPHNLEILDKEGGNVIVPGVAPFNGIAKKMWNFQAPKPGTYYFQCIVHPTTMNGQVIFQ